MSSNDTGSSRTAADSSEPIPPLVRPTHVAIIMDGNGRWATCHGKPRHAGHRAGVKAAREVVEACAESNVKVLTLFAFSSENWKRPPSEVDALMRLFVEVLQREVDTLHQNDIQLRFIGARDSLPTILRKRMADAEARTANNSRMTLVLAVAYGGQWDMVQAVRRITQKVRSGDLDPADIDEALIDRHRALAGLPAPDLLIRTGGEQRVSNFLLWDLAYTELCFTDTLWPDFGTDQISFALNAYGQRQRRFGLTGDQLEAVGD
ncbi:MAG: polyprenyl diphosphate synthase [Gammaproteobacteria bacterium]